MQVLQRPYDDPADNNPEFWQKCPTNKTLLSQTKIYESLLAVKRKGNKKESKFRTFRLIDDILICFSRKNLHQMKLLEFNKVICTIDISKEKDSEFPYGFSLCYNGKTQTFRSKEEEIIKEWMQALSWYSVSLDFEKKYKVLNKLGSGGYAKVYLVDHLPTNQQYAAKMIHFPKQDKSKDKKKHRDMILNEILALKKLDHPNVVKMNALYCVSGELCIVMEYIRGKKMIEDLKQKGRYSERKTAVIAKQLLLTLGHIHEKNIIHRDLKPENLLINQEDDNLEVKLVDFGLAAFIGLKYQGFKKCGTAGFIAPEIFRDEPFSDQIDVFSLGVILYVCLCGKPPFKGKNYYDLLKKNYLCEYKFNFKYWHNVSEEAKNLVSRMMDPYPNSRITIKEALNHEWFKVALKTDPSRSRSASKHLSQKKESELLKPGMKEGSNSNIQLNEDSANSAKVPDMTQKLKSLIFSSPNLSGNKDRLMQAKLPSFYQLSGVLSPSNKSGDITKFADADKLAEAENRDKKNEDFLRLNEPSNFDLTSQASFLRATPSNYDSPYQINIYTCKNVEDISDGEADDNAEGLQKLMKLYKNNSLKIKKPRESSPAKSINKTTSNPKRKRDHSKTHTSASKKEASDSRKAKDDQSITIENPSAKTEVSKSKVKGDSTPKNT